MKYKFEHLKWVTLIPRIRISFLALGHGLYIQSREKRNKESPVFLYCVSLGGNDIICFSVAASLSNRF